MILKLLFYNTLISISLVGVCINARLVSFLRKINHTHVVCIIIYSNEIS